MKGNHDIRRVKKSESKKLVELRKKIPIISWNKNYPKIFDWKFKTAFKEKEIPFWVIEEKKTRQLKAMMPIIPFTMKIGDKEYKTMWAVDVGRDEKYVDKELKVIQLYKIFRDQGTLSISKGITDESYVIEKKMRWEDFDIPHYFRFKILRSTPVVKHYLKNSFLSMIIGACIAPFNFLVKKTTKTNLVYDIKQFNSVNKEFDAFWKRIKNQYHTIVPRTSEYLKWKFDEHPLNKYMKFVAYDKKFAGYIIGRVANDKGMKIGFISDFLVDKQSNKVLEVLIDRITEEFERQKVDVIITSASQQNIHKILRKKGFLKRSRAIKTTFFLNDKKIEKSFNRGANTYMTLSDGDGDML